MAESPAVPNIYELGCATLSNPLGSTTPFSAGTRAGLETIASSTVSGTVHEFPASRRDAGVRSLPAKSTI